MIGAVSTNPVLTSTWPSGVAIRKDVTSLAPTEYTGPTIR
jgi:hypothetical protein